MAKKAKRQKREDFMKEVDDRAIDSKIIDLFYVRGDSIKKVSDWLGVPKKRVERGIRNALEEGL